MTLAVSLLLGAFVFLFPWAVITTIYAFVSYEKDGKSFAVQWVALILDACTLLALQGFLAVKIFQSVM